jgi:hypothetical protein
MTNVPEPRELAAALCYFYGRRLNFFFRMVFIFILLGRRVLFEEMVVRIESMRGVSLAQTEMKR